MKKVLRAVKWFVVNALFVLVAYRAVLLEDVGSERIVVFWVWMIFGISFLVWIGSNMEDVKRMLREKPRSVPQWIDLSLDVPLSLAFVYYGWVWIGMAYFFHAVFINAAFENVKETKTADGQ